MVGERRGRIGVGCEGKGGNEVGMDGRGKTCIEWGDKREIEGKMGRGQ